jgi:hypothetical protein
MNKNVLIIYLIFPGIIGFIVFGIYGIIDFLTLQNAYMQFENAVRSGNLTAITIAAAKQNIHRINLFAEGVWSLLSAIIAAIGIHGTVVKSVNKSSN